MSAAARSRTWLLCSFPKSGNTWLRILLEAWHREGPVDINALRHVGMLSLKHTFEDLLDADTGDLTDEEIDAARPVFHEALSASREADPEAVQPVYWYKSHDANLALRGVEPRPFPPNALGGVILVARDPRDVAPSLAAHNGVSIDTVIDRIADEERCLPGMNPFGQLPYRRSGWSGFYSSWLDTPDIRLLLVRYEDLAAHPFEQLTRILGFAGLRGTEERVRRAVEHAQFERLAQQEVRGGFRERPNDAAPFFRVGRAGGWKESLTAEQARRIVADHGAMMQRFGYTF